MNLEKVLQNNSITLARSTLALGMLLTLVFTSLDDLFPLHHILELKKEITGLKSLNIFLWFENILIPYIFSIIVLVITIFGFYPRVLTFFHCIVTYSIFHSMLIVEGGDQINSILTLLLVPISILDSRKNGWKNNDQIKCKENFFYYNAKYSLLFISIQMAILYLNASIAKMFAPEWTNGTAIYYWFYDNMFGAPNWLEYLVGFLFTNDISVSVINWSVIILELFLFIGIFLKQEYKYILFLLGVSFHILVILVHGLPTFFLAMTGGLILLFFQLDKNVSENINHIKQLIIKNKS